MTAGVKANVDGSAAIQVGGSDAINISTTLNVGIGASSPTSTTKFYVEQSAGNVVGYFNSTAASQNARVRINSTDTASSVAYVWSYSNVALNKQASIYLSGTGALAIQVGQTAGAEPTTGTTAMVIDSSGNVGIGTSSPAAKLDVRGSSTFLVNATNPTAWVSVDSALTTGSMYSQWNTTSNVGISGTYTNHAYTFVTNNTERARIDSSGNLLVGRTSSIGSARFVVEADTTIANPMSVSNPKSAAGSDYAIIFYRNGSIVGSIQTTLSATSYGTSSDYRLKENVQPMTGALAKVAALKPCTYTWKADGEAGQGFIAHELAEVVPDAVTGEKDAVNEDGSIKPQGIDTSFLVATLTAAIQEQQQMIETLQAKVAALEGA